MLCTKVCNISLYLSIFVNNKRSLNDISKLINIRRMSTKLPESTDEQDSRHYFQNRLETVQQWRQNKTAYPHKFEVSLSIKEFVEKYDHLEPGDHMDTEQVSIAGRVSRLASSSSKLRFLDIKSEGIKLQVFANFANHDQTTGDFNEIYNNIKRGDIVGITGFPGKSKRGELSVFPRSAMILSPCLHMLPDKFGLKDNEVRFRQRYLDFMMNDDSLNVMKTRSKIIDYLRRYFKNKNFFEVETPMLKITSTGASAKPFITHHNELEMDLFMRIAPELPLKLIIIGGFEKVFEIGKCFRNEGIDPTHNPEFTSLEFYWAYADYNDLIKLTEELLSSLVFDLFGKYEVTYHPDGPEGREVVIDFTPPFERVSMIEELENNMKTKLSPPYDSEENVQKYLKAIKEEGLDMPKPAVPAKLIDQLVGHFIEDRVVKPTFIVDFPQCTSPLAKWHRTKDNLVERFELFICGKELINAYTELNDPIAQRECFKEQQKVGKSRYGRQEFGTHTNLILRNANIAKDLGDDEAQPPDEDFCTALEYGLPPTGGWGMGIDRLTMFLTDKNNIKEVIFFPTMKPIVDPTQKQQS